ncbi:hypothetical protein DdX_15784 [Ditylenchus destructor]|uniref:Uncharacterized protein n=1 Tax=Ditylenchus destructor TaxID=166010 RepID=A0AAD4MPM9_9BILA|nr:hypothetical protein DdX_15784 [Ditylenchus destructor]
MAPLTVKGCGEVVEWFCTVRNRDNAALTRANADGYIYVWTQTGKSNKRKADGSELRKYICQGCRTLKNGKATQREYAGKEIPHRRLILNSDGKGEWVDANDCGKDAHFCEPRTDTELMGKQLFANHIEGIKTGSVKLPPTKCYSNLEATYSKTFSGLGENGIAKARDGGFACEIYHAHTQRYFTPGAYLGKPVKHRFAAFYAGLADQLDQCKEELKSAILDASGEIFLRGQISRFHSRT